jgi:hypothetical protein
MAVDVARSSTLVGVLVLAACVPLVDDAVAQSEPHSTGELGGDEFDPSATNAESGATTPPDASTGDGTDGAGTTKGSDAEGSTGLHASDGSDGSNDSSGSNGETSDPDGSSSTTASPPAELAHYRIRIDNTWSERTHPGTDPSLVPEYAHFSWLGGATHDDGADFWELGALASPGMVQMAESGLTLVLMDEVQAAIDGGHADAALSWQQWFCPPATDVPGCGEPEVEIDVTQAFARVTLVSMLGPSPDLFIGVDGLPLFVDGAWVQTLVVDLHPYDGGTRSDHDFTMDGALQLPPLPISVIASTDDHILGPGSLGTMTFERLW